MLETQSHQSSSAVSNGGGHRFKPQPPLYVPSGSVLFRLLCHSSRIGGVIGKSGSTIKNLQSKTSAKIRVEDAPPGSDERVIVVIASTVLSRTITLPDEEVEVSAAQEAVVRVFERILDVAAETNGVSVEALVGVVSCRLLVESFGVGAVMGKGGKVIGKIRNDTRSRIRVLGPEKLPASAWPNDELVEIEGDIIAVKKALIAVSRCIQDSPAVEQQRRLGSRPFETFTNDPLPNVRGFPPQRSSLVRPMPANFTSYVSGGRPLSVEANRAPTVDSNSRRQQQDVVFRMLCSVDLVGGVIGKGGTIIRALQHENGASVIIGAPILECPERVITVSASETSDSGRSQAQNAVVGIFNRLKEISSEKRVDSGPSSVSARLLVSPNQVGCLLGKGGKIISDMRKASGTSIWIIGDDQVPKCASENDEVVQITGEFVNVRHALYIVTGKLRDNLFSSKLPNGVGTKSGSSMISGTSPSTRPPPSTGLRASASASEILRQSNLTESMDKMKLNHNNDCPPSSRSFASQNTDGGVNSRSVADVGRQLSSVKGGTEIGSGSRSAFVMNTTLEIIVPENIIDSVYGENGSNLARLRQVSGAKVVVHEPCPGTTDRIVVISGTPDDTQAAQSLLQAFILTGRS